MGLSTSDHPNQSGPAAAPAEVAWTVHRARETPVKTAVVSLFIAAFIGLSLVAFGPALALVALIALFVALHTYYLPITYTLSARGVEIDKRIFSYTYEWSRFRRWFRTSGGVVLSPFTEKTFLDNFRGVHLLLPRDPSAVIACLEARFAPPAPDPRLEL
ncbi:MAG: hypothetical protein ABIK37_00835 [candidate division WOR-3 bacterium]